MPIVRWKAREAPSPVDIKKTLRSISRLNDSRAPAYNDGEGRTGPSPCECHDPTNDGIPLFSMYCEAVGTVVMVCASRARIQFLTLRPGACLAQIYRQTRLV